MGKLPKMFHVTRRALITTLLSTSATLLLLRKSRSAQGQQFEGRPVQGILFYGQSNAGPGGDAPPLLTTPAPSNILSFLNRRQFSGKYEIDTDSIIDFGPVGDVKPYPPMPATAMANALAALAIDKKSPLFFFDTVWYGSQPVSSFFPGTTSWLNLMNVTHRMAQLVRESNGLPSISALVFIQGESGPSNRILYRNQLTYLVSRIDKALQKETGQSYLPRILLTQTNAGAIAAPTSSEVDLAQWDVAQKMNKSVVLAGPMYQMPLEGNIHQNAEGRMMLGELLALIYQKTILKGERFFPLNPDTAERDQTGVTIQFQLPDDTQALGWDNSWIAASPYYGFSIHDQSGEIPIKSVDITDRDVVRITWARFPVSGPIDILYAQGQPTAPGWSSCRGQLMAESSIDSPFAKQGFKIPQKIRHYCLRFKLKIK